MTKKGPLGTAEMYYVKGHYKDEDAASIAKALDRPVTTVKRHIDKLIEEDPQSLTAGSQMARRDGVVTMTENASSIGDHPSRPRKELMKRKECIARIKDGSVHDDS